MIKEIRVAPSYSAVPYLKGSALMASHPDGIKFSKDKPNVIVGPNGAGKSALMKSLAFYTLSYLTGTSMLDGHYVGKLNGLEELWTNPPGWREDWSFMAGFECDADLALAVYYAPRMIPGDESSLAHAFMKGYSEQARAYGKATDNKSSGQAAQAVLETAVGIMTNGVKADVLPQLNWGYGTKPIALNRDRGYVGPWDEQAEVLKRLRKGVHKGKPVVLLDEPEQSLDTVAQLKLWAAIEQAAPHAQVIVATHSLWPLLHPERFNIIEAQPGFIETALSLLK